MKNIHDIGAGIKYLKCKSKGESFYDGWLNEKFHYSLTSFSAL